MQLIRINLQSTSDRDESEIFNNNINDGHYKQRDVKYCIYECITIKPHKYVSAILQLCVHFYQLCMHFYKCAYTFTKCACTL